MENKNDNSSNNFDPISLQAPNLSKQKQEETLEKDTYAKQIPPKKEKIAPVKPHKSKTLGYSPSRVLLKIFYIVIFIIILGIILYYVSTQIISKDKEIAESQILLQAPYQPVNWQGFGNIFEPIIKLSVVYPQQGVKKVDFLLDSGALVSSLPREEAASLGYESLADLPRSTFRGYGGTSSFAYKGQMTILMNEKQIDIPVVFTEAQATKKIIGRSGFFQEFSIHFNAKKKIIEIRE